MSRLTVDCSKSYISGVRKEHINEPNDVSHSMGFRLSVKKEHEKVNFHVYKSTACFTKHVFFGILVPSKLTLSQKSGQNHQVSLRKPWCSSPFVWIIFPGSDAISASASTPIISVMLFLAEKGGLLTWY